MPERSRYRVSLDELEASAHVEPEDLIVSVDLPVEPMADPRGPQPDRDWFDAGG